MRRSCSSVRSVRPAVTRARMAQLALDEADLERMLDHFYREARADPELGPLFATVDDWNIHLQRVVDFWSSVLLSTGRYHRPMVAVHRPLQLRPSHFHRWLTLFGRAARRHCSASGAEALCAAARRIAAAMARQLDLPDLVHSKEQDMSATPVPPPEDPAALTEYIEAHYHRRHREQLALLTAAGSAGTLSDPLRRTLERLAVDLDAHMQKEEQVLFPMIRAGGAPWIRQPITVMRAEHREHEAAIAELERLLAGSDSAGERSAVEGEIRALIADLRAHMALENDVLFPRFEGGGDDARSP
ncbi:MAG: hypothetical protein KatS3mg124_1312 [Porticoccaceae bacterium]|nr:MAG: hypothetical protein KatS3mg124_1312 [Porticoccaceae bacterium]